MLIDRYIGRAQCHAFLIVFVSLAGLYFVFDAFTNIDEFVVHAAEAGGLVRVLASYYGCRMLWFFDATSPVVSMAAAMFTMSWLERHNELTALLAAGVTRWRIARPVLLLAAAVSVAALLNRELCLPQVREAFARNAQNLRGDRPQPFDARYDHATEILFRGRAAIVDDRRIESPSLLMPPQLGDYGTQIDAAAALWRPADADHPAGWLLTGVTEPADIDRLEPLVAGSRTVVQTRATAAWLEPRQCFVASDVGFEQMIGSTNWSQYSATPDLLRAIRNRSLGVGGDVPLRVHSRFTAPLLDMTLVLLGLPLVLGPVRRGVFIAVGLCVGTTVLFFVVVLGSQALAMQDICSPSLGAWLPLLALAPLAAWRAQPMWQ
ncbi:MAG: LptF/LptG family permease [Planctomycetaceae bacterium]